MKHKSVILISTVILFVFATVLSFAWLLRIRYVETTAVAELSQEDETYSEVNGLLENLYMGKFYFSVRVDDIIEKLKENPYLNVKSVKKVFPDRIKVEIERRKERFAIIKDGEFYITDSEYYLLRKETDENKLNEGIIKITLINVDLKTESLVLGNKIGYANDNLVGCMTSIFNGFEDGLNLVDGVEVLGVQNWIRFSTKTGVCIEFSFAPSSPSLSAEQIKAENDLLVAKAGEVEEYYNGLTEYNQNVGYILVYTKATGEIKIEHVVEKTEV